jgi:hypothetical protein
MALTDDDLPTFETSLQHLETTLLTEFRKLASLTDAQQRANTEALQAIHLRMKVLSDRVAKLEGKAATKLR